MNGDGKSINVHMIIQWLTLLLVIMHLLAFSYWAGVRASEIDHNSELLNVIDQELRTGQYTRR